MGVRRVSIGRAIVLWLPAGLVAVWLAFAPASPARTTPEGHPAEVQVWFSPQGGCTEGIVRELDRAKREVLVQAYSFTSAPIAKALLSAHRRGIQVEVILDRSQRTQKYSSATFLRRAGIPTWIDDKHAIAHNKVMVIDGSVVFTGSFNFTAAAEDKNAENLVVLRSPSLAQVYRDNWEHHREHSAPYMAGEVPFSPSPRRRS